MVSQKSISESDATMMKMSLIKMKTLTFTLDRQSSNFNGNHIINDHKADTYKSLQYLNQIKEDAINDFDKQKTYDIYFPEFNLEVVLDSIS